jgi:mitotic spindle assembly checkpoint protein MAD1
VLEEEEATQKEGERLEELEQTLFELRGEIGAGQHVPPSVQVLKRSKDPHQMSSRRGKVVMAKRRRNQWETAVEESRVAGESLRGEKRRRLKILRTNDGTAARFVVT